jgi:hypothetical protein
MVWEWILVAGTPITLNNWRGIHNENADDLLFDEAENIEDNEWWAARNVDLLREGTYVKRDYFGQLGQIIVGDAVDDLIILGVYRTFDPVVRNQVIFANNANIFKLDRLAGNAITKISTDGNARFGVQYKDKFYIISTSSGLLKWDGTTVTSVLPDLDGGWCTIHKDRLWICPAFEGFEGKDSRLFYSEPGDPETFPSVNFIDINPGDGQLLYGGVSLFDNLILFKRNSLYLLSVLGAPTNWELRKLNLPRGVDSSRGFINIYNTIYFANPAGFYKTDGNIVVELSSKVRHFFDPTGTEGPAGSRQLTSLGFVRDRIIMSLGHTSDARLLVYHIPLDSFTTYTYSETNAAGLIGYFSQDVEDDKIYWGLRDKLGVYAPRKVGVFPDFSSGDLGVAGDFPGVFLRTKDYDFDNPHTIKRMFYTILGMTISSGSVTLKYLVDGKYTSTVTFNPGADASLQSNFEKAWKLLGAGKFRRVALEFSGSSTMTTFALRSITFFVSGAKPTPKTASIIKTGESDITQF